jgi:hypothetical protein
MKTVRILAMLPLALISLFDIGYPFGTEPKPDAGLAVAVAALGVAGFVAVYGVVRNAGWGRAAALGAAGVNVVGAFIALVNDSEGAVTGLVISCLALVMTLALGSVRRMTLTA